MAKAIAEGSGTVQNGFNGRTGHFLCTLIADFCSVLIVLRPAFFD